MPGDAVEVPAPGFVEEPLHVALDDHDRIGVVGQQRRREEFAAHVQHVLAGGAGVGPWLVSHGGSVGW